MSIIVVTIASILLALIIYLLVNSYVPLTNKINNTLKINSRGKSMVYMFAVMLCYVPLYFYADYDNKLSIAQQNGYDDYKVYRAELGKAEKAGLPLQAYQREMVKAAKLGLHNYQDYVNLLEAQDYGYSDFDSYQADLNAAQKYGLPLYVYTDAKAEADAKNFTNFDDYIIDREKQSLIQKMAGIVSLEGDYNIDNVPLGVKKSELLSTIYNCKISQIPDYTFPVTKSLAPRSEAHISHFFPETQKNSHFGLNLYSMNFTVMPGLDRQVISKYEMKCEDARYDLWFLNDDDSLVLYEKTINLPNIRKLDAIERRLTQTLLEKCDSDINIGIEASFEENGTRSVKNMYCKNFQDYIVATIVEGPMISGVRQDADIHIGYLSERRWNQYIDNLKTVKSKKSNVQFTQSDGKNKTKTFESRI
ncbi:hypothetical protein HII17_18385 [Thalassotalea sp. M1531]|uniref:Uncharacterized protein n=1 Tax=Thalassotalea algicola TaxID=2716224 RepID=A0A7Y0LFF3_9GAMM|nr:hypothetical protein [Thalassotalea algicola]NMP33519.1 hypothetical protein [Thalassotalea algicola]